ncbi:hypothetical protein QOZ80_9BG0699480 [Eleusine coracana subsp. coracana]|nr:hypothetical protein QOZ80_9BG0699480 [Eleusine coracana subsp. coracana]
MKIATELKGSFLGANLLGEMLRANPNTQFWCSILSSIRELVQKHLFSLAVHPEDLLERNSPVDFAKVAFVGDQGQGCLVYDLREAGPEQVELPLLTSQEVLWVVRFLLGRSSMCRYGNQESHLTVTTLLLMRNRSHNAWLAKRVVWC